MRRASKRLTLYLGTVVMPVTMGVWAAGYLRSLEVIRLQVEEDGRMAQVALGLLADELSDFTDLMIDSTEVVSEPDDTQPGVVAAQRGDSVTALELEEHGLRVSLYLPLRDSTVAPPGAEPRTTTFSSERFGVRMVTAPFPSEFLRTMEGVAGFETALYLNGKLASSTDPHFGPDAIPAVTYQRLGSYPKGHPFEVNGGAAVLLGMNPTPSSPPQLAVLVRPSRTPPSAIPRVVPAILLLLAGGLSTLGWWLLVHKPQPDNLRPGRIARGRMALLVLLPMATGWASLLYLGKIFQQDNHRLAVTELARAMAVVRMVGEDMTLSEMASLVGFDVTWKTPDQIPVSTLPEGPVRAAIEALGPPPATFTTAGHAGEGRGRHEYVAGPRPGGGIMVLSGPGPDSRLRSLRLRLMVLGIGVAFLVLTFPAVAAHYEAGMDREWEEE